MKKLNLTSLIIALIVFISINANAQNDFVIGLHATYGYTISPWGSIIYDVNKPNTSNSSSIFSVINNDGFNLIRTWHPDYWISHHNYKNFIKLIDANNMRLIDSHAYWYKPAASTSSDGRIPPSMYYLAENIYDMSGSFPLKALYNYTLLYNNVYNTEPMKSTMYGHIICGESAHNGFYPLKDIFPPISHTADTPLVYLLQYFSKSEVPPANVSDAFGYFQGLKTTLNLSHKLINTQANHNGSYLNFDDGVGIYSTMDYLNHNDLVNKGDLFIEASYFNTVWKKWIDVQIPNPTTSGLDYLGKFESIDISKNYYNRVFSEIEIAYVTNYDIKTYSWYSNIQIPNGNHVWFLTYNAIVHGATGVLFHGFGGDYDLDDTPDTNRRNALNDVTSSNDNFVFANTSYFYQSLLSNLSKELRYLKEQNLLTDNPASIIYTKTVNSDVNVNDVLPASTTYLLSTVTNANAQDLTAVISGNPTSFTNNHRGEDYGLRYSIRTNGTEVIMIITNPNPYSITSNVPLNFNNLTNPIIAKSTGVNILFEDPQYVTSNTYKIDRDWVDRQVFIDNVMSSTPDLDIVKCNMRQYAIPFPSTNNKTISLNFGPFDVKVIKFGGESINTNTTWNTDMIFENDVVVESGNTLTIESTIKFMHNTKIIVKPGGELIIDGGTLTSSCDNLWKGVLVQGTMATQTPENNQGVLQMINGATIENAEVAVYVGEYFVPNHLSSVNSNFGGGIIKIASSFFKNNQRDIVMRPYELGSITTGKLIPQLSYIKQTEFENDTYIFNDVAMNKGKIGNILAIGIHGLGIYANIFKNLDNTLALEDRGIGIEAHNSSLNIASAENPQCPTCAFIKNQFINLNYGVKITNGLHSDDIIKITDNTFTNTYRAIYLSGTNNAEVILNTILADDMAATQSGQPTPPQPYGIYLNGGKGFRIEENTVWRPTANGAATFNGSRGIVVHNTGSENNQIYRNILDNLFLSEQAQGFNSGKGIKAEKGLKFFCNTSETDASFYDFYVFGDFYLHNWSLHRSGIATVQQQPNYGSISTPYYPAGNTFSNTHQSITLPLDYDNAQGQIIDYYWGNITNNTGRIEPLKYANINPKQITGSHDACPSKISSGGNGNTQTELYTKLNTAQIAYNSSKVILDIWKDGGNANLDNEVETTQPWDVYQQFNSLLAESPYLSEEVLIEIINNPSFTSLMVKLLMLANPHGKESFEVMEALENRLPAMPQTYMDDIINQASSSSQLKTLEGNVAADYHLISNIGEDIKRMYRDDNTNAWAKDSLIAFTSRQADIYDKFELATIYLSYGQYDDMQNVLSNIPSIFEMEAEMTTELNDFTSVLNIAKDMQENNLYEEGLSEVQKASLETLLGDNKPITSVMALALLKRDNPNYVFNEIVHDVSQNSSRLAKPKANTNTESQNEEFKLYPNPALDYTTLKYNCKYEKLNYTISDMQGKLLVNNSLKTICDITSNEVLINLGGLSPGNYQIIIKSNNVILWSEKLIITE